MYIEHHLNELQPYSDYILHERLKSRGIIEDEVNDIDMCLFRPLYEKHRSADMYTREEFYLRAISDDAI